MRHAAFALPRRGKTFRRRGRDGELVQAAKQGIAHEERMPRTAAAGRTQLAARRGLVGLASRIDWGPSLSKQEVDPQGPDGRTIGAAGLPKGPLNLSQISQEPVWSQALSLVRSVCVPLSCTVPACNQTDPARTVCPTLHLPISRVSMDRGEGNISGSSDVTHCRRGPREIHTREEKKAMY